MNGNGDNLAQDILLSLGGAIQAQANRPQKTNAITYTTTNSTPYALADMIARRDTLGETRQALKDALATRESRGYGFADALSKVPLQQGQGSWLGNLARGFGSGFNARTNAAIAKAQADYDNAQADLATALAYDKAMGEIQNQTQRENIGYTQPAGTAGGAGVASQINFGNLGDGYDINKFLRSEEAKPAFSLMARAASRRDPQDNPTVAAEVARQFVPDDVLAQRQYTIDQLRKISGTRLAQAVKELGGARGADTIREAQIRIGQVMDAPWVSSTETAELLDAAKQDVKKSIDNDRVRGGYQPLTDEQWDIYWKSMWDKPSWAKDEEVMEEKTTEQETPKGTILDEHLQNIWDSMK